MTFTLCFGLEPLSLYYQHRQSSPEGCAGIQGSLTYNLLFLCPLTPRYSSISSIQISLTSPKRPRTKLSRSQEMTKRFFFTLVLGPHTKTSLLELLVESGNSHTSGESRSVHVQTSWH